MIDGDDDDDDNDDIVAADIDHDDNDDAGDDACFSSTRTCIVPRTRSSYGDRGFAATGPRLWNSLPSHLRLSDIGYNDFKRQLKTFLFG